MKRHGNLWHKVIDFNALCQAAGRAAKGKSRSRDAGKFIFNLENEVFTLIEQLQEGTYLPAPYRTFNISDPKERTISAAAFRDRVVHHALCAAVEPILESYAIKDSYACRKGKGSHAALGQARKFMHSHSHFLKLDVLKYFETIDIPTLKTQLARKIKDKRVLHLIDVFLDHGAPGSSPGKGLPIGNLTSQHFANFYLGHLDHFIKEELRVKGYVRYMDDMILFGHNKATLHQWHKQVNSFISKRLHLQIKNKTTIIAPVHEGLPFLGFRVYPGVIRLDRGSCWRFRRKLTERVTELNEGIIDEHTFAQCAASLIGHTLHGSSHSFRTSILEQLTPGWGTEKGSNRVKRGGSWNNNARNCRAGNRNNNRPDNRNNNLGFRLLSSIPSPKNSVHGR